MVKTFDHIINQLPYRHPFLFVDGLTAVSDDGVEGYYTYDANSEFYQGHFIDHPVTPGVILSETMAQIGVACLGIHLLAGQVTQAQIAMTSMNVDYLKPVYPGEKVVVKSEKNYFRFNKLKCRVVMFNQKGEEVCKGELAGMIISSK